MAIFKDLYIIKWLIANTNLPNPKIRWQIKESGGYFALIGKRKDPIKIEIAKVQSRPLPRIIIKLSCVDLGEVTLQEPVQKVLSLRKAYDSQDDSDLAESMTELLITISRQLSQEDLNDSAAEEEKRKQKIFELCQEAIDN